MCRILILSLSRERAIKLSSAMREPCVCKFDRDNKRNNEKRETRYFCIAVRCTLAENKHIPMGDARNSIWEMDFDQRCAPRVRAKIFPSAPQESCARAEFPRAISSPEKYEISARDACEKMSIPRDVHFPSDEEPRGSLASVAGTQRGLESFQREFPGVPIFLAPFPPPSLSFLPHSAGPVVYRPYTRRRLIYFARDKRVTRAVRRCLKIPP